jgi:hypothetical protein
MTPKFRSNDRTVRDSRRKDKAESMRRKAIRGAKYAPAEESAQYVTGAH